MFDLRPGAGGPSNTNHRFHMPSSFSSKQLLTAAIDAVIVLAAAGHETFAWAHWPVYAAALAAQLTLSTLFACLRDRIDDGQGPPLRDVMGVPTAMDVILTFPALSIAAVAGDAPLGTALTWAALLTIAAGILSERNGRPTRATERDAMPGCATSRSATCADRRLPRQPPGSSTITPAPPIAGAVLSSRRLTVRGSSCLVGESSPATTAGVSIAIAG